MLAEPRNKGDLSISCTVIPTVIWIYVVCMYVERSQQKQTGKRDLIIVWRDVIRTLAGKLRGFCRVAICSRLSTIKKQVRSCGKSVSSYFPRCLRSIVEGIWTKSCRRNPIRRSQRFSTASFETFSNLYILPSNKDCIIYKTSPSSDSLIPG